MTQITSANISGDALDFAAGIAVRVEDGRIKRLRRNELKPLARAAGFPDPGAATADDMRDFLRAKARVEAARKMVAEADAAK